MKYLFSLIIQLVLCLSVNAHAANSIKDVASCSKRPCEEAPITDNSSQSIEDKWDGENKTYINYTCSFYWRLNKNMQWVKQPLLQQDAIFGAVDVDTRIVAYITATKIEEIDSDNYIWEHESEFYNGLKDSYKQMPNAQMLEKKRVYIGGKKALKTKVAYSLVNDDRFGGENLNTIIISYHVIHQGYGITFSIMAFKEIEEELEKYGTSIETIMFTGLTFVAPNSLK